MTIIASKKPLPISKEELNADIKSISKKFDEKLNPLSEKLQKAWLNPDDRLEVDDFIFSVNGTGCATVGNGILFIGKGKSKKSMFIAGICSVLLGGKSFSIIKSFQDNHKILYVDTEQAKRHCQLQYKRIEQLSGRKIKDHLDYLMLRPNGPKERVQLIEEGIYSKDYSFIIIDGIADLLSKGVNDEEEAIMITNLIMKWSLERNVAIAMVLHQNKGDSNAKGHIGSQLVQKCETIFSIEKDLNNSKISTVTAPQTRGMEIDPFHFSLDENGLPFVIDDYKPNNIKKAKSKNPFDYEREVHISILLKVFEISKELKYSDLKAKFRHVLGSYSILIGESKSRDWITYYKEEKLIIQEGEMKPYMPSKSVRYVN